MRFTTTNVAGAQIVDLDRHEDDRGFFARTFCDDEFAAAGLDQHFPQSNLSHNSRRGTLRGMHHDTPPSAESKLVTCTYGSIFDVVIDLRPASATYMQWMGVELSRANGRAVYVPTGCAHGFLTLEHDVDVRYQMGARHQPGREAGVRWDDPAFEIDWPFAPVIISSRDANFPDYVTHDGS